MKDNKSASLFQKEQVMESLKQSFVKLNPRVMIKNPIMFTVEVVTVVMLIVCFLSLGTSEYGAFGYNFLVFIILFCDVAVLLILLKPSLKRVVRPKLTACVKPVKRLRLKCWLTVRSIPLAVHV